MVRTQLSVRVHAIIGKCSLRCAHAALNLLYNLLFLSVCRETSFFGGQRSATCTLLTQTGLSGGQGSGACLRCSGRTQLSGACGQLRGSELSELHIACTGTGMDHSILPLSRVATDQISSRPQVMLYVDGMNGVMKHQPTMEWLYSLIASSYRSVVKTALKLLLVFVEYAESNCYVLVSAIHAVDEAQRTVPWTNIMR